VPFWSKKGEGETQHGSCASASPAPALLPAVRAEHRTAAYWIGLSRDVDAVVLSPEEIARHNQALAAHDASHPKDEPLRRLDLTTAVDEGRLRRELEERSTFLAERVKDGSYVDAHGKPLGDDVKRALATSFSPAGTQELRVAVAPISLRCGPHAGPLYKGPDVDPRFDRNSCSGLRTQEPVRLIGSPAGGMVLSRSSYAFGWVAADAALSPPLSAEHALLFATGRRVKTTRAVTLKDGAVELEVPADSFLVAA
jgi:hypothetical protein